MSGDRERGLEIGDGEFPVSRQVAGGAVASSSVNPNSTEEQQVTSPQRSADKIASANTARSGLELPRSTGPQLLVTSEVLPQARSVRPGKSSRSSSHSALVGRSFDRLAGVMMVTRAFGNAFLKWPGYSARPFSQHLPYLTAAPEITVRRLRAQDLFLVVACDGVWENISNQEAVDAVSGRMYVEHCVRRAMGDKKWLAQSDSYIPVGSDPVGGDPVGSDRGKGRSSSTPETPLCEDEDVILGVGDAVAGGRFDGAKGFSSPSAAAVKSSNCGSPPELAYRESGHHSKDTGCCIRSGHHSDETERRLSPRKRRPANRNHGVALDANSALDTGTFGVIPAHVPRIESVQFDERDGDNLVAPMLPSNISEIRLTLRRYMQADFDAFPPVASIPVC